MSQRQNYLKELSYLRELGREFSRAHPEIASLLGESGSDPDVGRLLEGFAFLTGRVRERLDSEYPEFTRALLELFMPAAVRPIPATVILRFGLVPQAAKETRRLPVGTEVGSRPIDGTVCKFRSCTATTVRPLRITDVALGHGLTPVLRIGFATENNVPLEQQQLDELRVYLGSDVALAQQLALCLLDYAARFTLEDATGVVRQAPGVFARPAAFEPEGGLVPYSGAMPLGYRHLWEYLNVPTMFAFVDLCGLSTASLSGNRFVLHVELDRVPNDLPALGVDTLRLNCAPAVNIYAHTAVPVRVDPLQPQMRVRAEGNAEHHQIWAITSVCARLRGRGETRTYSPMYRRWRAVGDDRFFYHATPASSTGDGGGIWQLSLAGAPIAELTYGVDTLSLDLLCTNSSLVHHLGLGDVSQTTPLTPSGTTCINITRPTSPVPPPDEETAHWRLLGFLSLNQRELADRETIQEALRIFHFAASHDRKAERELERMLEGLVRVDRRPARRLYRGVPVNGTAVRIELADDRYGGESGAFAFGTVINECLASLTRLNTFCQLTVHATRSGASFTWPPRLGRQTID